MPKVASKSVPTEVTTGLRFRSLIADEKALWEVVDPVGRGYWECVVLDEKYVVNGQTFSGDFAGRLQAFSAGDILGALRIDALFGGYDPARYNPREPQVFG